MRPYRGWSEQDWLAAAARLTDRGWLDTEHRLTASGRAARSAIEADTDRLAAPFVTAIGAESAHRAIAALRPLADALADRVIPYPNAMGVDRPT